MRASARATKPKETMQLTEPIPSDQIRDFLVRQVECDKRAGYTRGWLDFYIKVGRAKIWGNSTFRRVKVYTVHNKSINGAIQIRKFLREER